MAIRYLRYGFAFTGAFTSVLAKHSKNFNLIPSLDLRFGNATQLRSDDEAGEPLA
jgi:hypothetical protein